MKLNRFFALGAIALLVVGTMGVLSARSFAQTTAPPSPDASDAYTTNDENQVGDQNAVDGGEALQASGTETVTEPMGDQNTPDLGTQTGETTNGQEAAPVSTPAITADQAKAIAEASVKAGTATKVELDDEDGKLVYSVEIGQTDVKVDAMTGTVLNADAGGD